MKHQGKYVLTQDVSTDDVINNNIDLYFPSRLTSRMSQSKLFHDTVILFQ